MKRPSLVILDRDGVINYDSDAYIKSPQEWQPIPGSLQAIAKLNAAKIPVVVATNQSGIARGFFSLATLQAIHQEMQHQLSLLQGKLDGIYFCPHGPEDHCDCRKPKAGLLKQIQRDFPQQFQQAIVVGDSLRDLQAAYELHCEALLVRTGKGEKTLAQNTIDPSHVFQDLAAIVDYWLVD